jgi:type VII secretion integral membrane protein EccD
MTGCDAAYCAVTVVCGQSRLDVALPAAVPVIDLLPALLRLLPTGPAARWELAPIGRPVLLATETLERAGVLGGDVLMMQPASDRAPLPAPAASLRDQLEDVVQLLDRGWTRQTSTRFLFWSTAVLGAAALLGQAAGPAGGLTITMQLIVAGVLAAAAMAAVRSGEAVAAACLLVGCGWGALAGWGASSAGGPVAALGGAAVAAFLLAAIALPGYPGAMVHGGAVGVIAIGAAIAGIAAAAGARQQDIAVGLAVAAVLAIGAAPRVVLAATGLKPSESGRVATVVDVMFARADRLLIGLLIGLSLVATASALPSAFAGDTVSRTFAVVVGVALLLRSRSFSQVPHLIAERIAGVGLLAAVGVAWYLAEPGLRGLLILALVMVVASLAAVSGLTVSAETAIGRARTARALDLAEQVLVVAMIGLATGMLGLFHWVGSVLG